MTELICDICGTTYPETDEKCPTCGYSRGLTVFTPYDGQEHAPHEKIRGGRFSKKNVQKRLQERAEAENEAAQIAAQEAAAEDIPEMANQNENVDDGQALPVLTTAAAVEETAEPVAEEMPAPIPEETEELTQEEPDFVEPVENLPEGTEEDREKAVLAIFRRDVRMNLLLFFASVVFLLSSAYLVVTYGIPYLKTLNQPAQIVTEAPTQAPTEASTEAPTEAPTEVPTEAPTEAPTQAPTEAPTQAPTEAPTEAPTVAVTTPLTLNYYDLTFRGANQGVQLEVAGYNSADITWTSDDPAVATVSETGKVVSVGNGATTIRASYGGQTVSCTIRCNFS